MGKHLSQPLGRINKLERVHRHHLLRGSRTRYVQTSYWARRERLKVQGGKRNAPQTTSEVELERVTSFLNDLRIPFLAPCLRQKELSDNQILNQLRWLVYAKGATQPSKDQIKYQVHQTTRVALFNQENDVPWDSLPTRAPHYDIHWYLVKLARRWRQHGNLALPSQWTIFSNVDWGELLYSEATDSRTSDRLRSVGNVKETPKPTISEGPLSVSIGCEGRNVYYRRLREQWELLVSMSPRRFWWTYQTEESALRRDELRHAGRTDLNQAGLNQDLWPQRSILALLRLWEYGELDPYYFYTPLVSEIPCSHRLGRLLAVIVSTEAFPVESRAVFQWPALLSQMTQTPEIDYACRAKPRNRSSFRNLDFLLFAAQYRGADEGAAVRQLAMAFQPMMILFILYYLDTRSARDERMPWWMSLFGIIYDENGITIHSYHPASNMLQLSTSNVVDIGWNAISWRVTSNYFDCARQPPYKRGGLLASLYRIQGHCAHVLQKLEDWDGYERVWAQKFS